MDNSHRFEVGKFNCLAINDGGINATAEMLFRNAPEGELEQALQDHGLAPDRLPSLWTCLLVETGEHLVLIDTGENNCLGYGGGQLWPALAAAGVRASDVDTVILTHGHPDHIGGCVDADGRPAFASARHVMWEAEWDYWRSEANLKTVPEMWARTVRRCLPPIAPNMDTINAEEEIVPGIRPVVAPGHTVGHMALEITSGGERLLNIADAALHPIHLAHPEWASALDNDPEQTALTRRSLCQYAAEMGLLVLAFHFMPFPSLGHIVERGDAWGWEPI